jgi:hypothetical protein
MSAWQLNSRGDLSVIGKLGQCVRAECVSGSVPFNLLDPTDVGHPGDGPPAVPTVSSITQRHFGSTTCTIILPAHAMIAV